MRCLKSRNALFLKPSVTIASTSIYLIVLNYFHTYFGQDILSFASYRLTIKLTRRDCRPHRLDKFVSLARVDSLIVRRAFVSRLFT